YIQGRLHLARRQYDSAMNDFQEILKTPEGLSENLMVGATLGMADARLALSGPDAADNVIEDFLWQHPDVTGIGVLFRRLDEFYAAETTPSDSELEKWASKPPPDKRAALAAFYLAKSCARARKTDKALETIANFISANPEHPLLAEAYLLQGKIQL